MSEQRAALCAHLHVGYVPIKNDDGTMSDRWECCLCDHQFWPVAPTAKTKRCQERNKETGQCEFRDGHDGQHLAGYLLWPTARAEPQPDALEPGISLEEINSAIEAHDFASADPRINFWVNRVIWLRDAAHGASAQGQPDAIKRMKEGLACLYLGANSAVADDVVLRVREGIKAIELAAEQRATRAARLEEAEWWEHLAPDCGMPPSGNPNCIYCQRLAELRAALSAPELKVTVSSSGMPGVAPPSWTEGSAPAQTPSEEERKWK